MPVTACEELVNTAKYCCHSHRCRSSRVRLPVPVAVVAGNAGNTGPPVDTFRCGDSEKDLAADVAKLTGLATKVLTSYQVTASPDSKMVEEVVRYGGCELHATSSVVKLVAKQYSPLCNTLIFDGLQGKMQVLEVDGAGRDMSQEPESIQDRLQRVNDDCNRVFHQA
eukprot:symbB.v1.2.018070.t1/scaffold1427.1/size119462/10